MPLICIAICLWALFYIGPRRPCSMRTFQPERFVMCPPPCLPLALATVQCSACLPRNTKSAKQVPQEPPDRKKRCATCARAARSPDASCLIVSCAVAAGIQRRKHTPNQQRSTKIRPHNRCHLLRTQKVQSRCHRSRPIVRKGAQRAHGPPAAPMLHDA